MKDDEFEAQFNQGVQAIRFLLLVAASLAAAVVAYRVVAPYAGWPIG